MRRIFKTLMTSLKLGSQSKAPEAPPTSQTATYFKKVEARPVKDAPGKGGPNPKVEERIRELDRIILNPFQANRVLARIEEIVFRANFNPVSEDVKEACEIVHHAAVNQQPVRVSLVKMLIPDLEFNEYEVLDEKEYDAFLQSRSNRYETPAAEIQMDDPVGVRSADGRGRAPEEEWKMGRRSQGGNKGSGFKQEKVDPNEIKI
eukprot:TRINITY_DN4269_c0_g1_i5.p2 TRINITY_DN4269_c0_g1~~TRINITY_DN4269_c0_g1_i5.p2  ORF type:complete len:204 (+),score=62.59 TRINITY_DN4269_c0_g1_i5:98-709(+)